MSDLVSEVAALTVIYNKLISPDSNLDEMIDQDRLVSGLELLGQALDKLKMATSHIGPWGFTPSNTYEKCQAAGCGRWRLKEFPN
jgi:hypothetical protein